MATLKLLKFEQATAECRLKRCVACQVGTGHGDRMGAPVQEVPISTRLVLLRNTSCCFCTYCSRPGPGVLLVGLRSSITVTTR